ncbi:MAG: 3'(2'),5'-bisphosphate nucleotidase CysQ [Deltaproteobacteria bacterium]|nr:3'(2'),5'-bisphosphate nucleotidase CysQ [Deltaproteobacteria bacterium]
MTGPAADEDAPLAREVAVATRLARAAGAAIERIRQEGFQAHRKADRSLVTRADLAAEALLREGLSEAFPDDGLLSEETAGLVASASGRTWVVDPLDGTHAYVHGQAGYAVQVGLVDRGEPVLGVVYEPLFSRLYRASRGAGAWLESPDDDAPVRLHVSERRERARMPLVTSTSMDADERAALIRGLGLADAGGSRSVGCKVGYLVRQQADVYVSEHPVHLWDSLAPLVVLLEAGGAMSLADGTPLAYDLSPEGRLHPGPFVASNGTDHEALCDEVRTLLRW